jgi:hypothetical protein
MLKDVRNTDGKLVARINEGTGEIIIALRGCVTKLHYNADGLITVTNTKEKTKIA